MKERKQNEETGDETIQELQHFSPESIFIQVDLSDRDNLKEIVKTVIATYGNIDILVNSAHASKNKPFEEITEEDLDLSFNTGFYPTFYLMQYSLPYLKESKGKMINFASGAGINGNIDQASYAAAK